MAQLAPGSPRSAPRALAYPTAASVYHQSSDNDESNAQHSQGRNQPAAPGRILVGLYPSVAAGNLRAEAYKLICRQIGVLYVDGASLGGSGLAGAQHAFALRTKPVAHQGILWNASFG